MEDKKESLGAYDQLYAGDVLKVFDTGEGKRLLKYLLTSYYFPVCFEGFESLPFNEGRRVVVRDIIEKMSYDGKHQANKILSEIGFF